MGDQCCCQLSKRFELCLDCFIDPVVQKLGGPSRGGVAPEVLEGFLEQVAAHRAVVDAHQLGQSTELLAGQVLLALEQNPPRVLEGCGVTSCSQLSRLVSTHVVNGLTEETHDVEAVKDVNRGIRPSCDRGDERPPHVTRYELQLLATVLAEPHEETVERCGGPVLSNPQQAFAAVVDLINQGHVLLPLVSRQLVDANRFDAIECHVRSPPSDSRLDCGVHRLPADLKARRRLLPTERLRPTGQEPDQGRGHLALAFCPGNQFNLDATEWAVAASRRVDQEHGNGPKRDELVVPFLQTVVCHSLLAATRAHRLGASARTNRNVDPCRCPTPNEFRTAINKTRLLLNSIEDRLYLHRVGLFWCGNRHVDTMRLWLRASTRLSPNGSASKMRTLRPHRTSEHRARHHALVALAPHTARLRDYVTRRCTISRPQILVKSRKKFPRPGLAQTSSVSTCELSARRCRKSGSRCAAPASAL